MVEHMYLMEVNYPVEIFKVLRVAEPLAALVQGATSVMELFYTTLDGVAPPLPSYVSRRAGAGLH